MLKHCVIHGKNIGFFDSGMPKGGRGTLMFLHCSNGSYRMFIELIEVLSRQYRILAPDLLGYGSSESWPVNEPYHWQYDVDILLHLLALADTPVHCIGYSYGGFLALEASLQAPQQIASLFLAEPAALHLLRYHPDNVHWQSTREVAMRCANAVASGDLRRAASIYLKFWGNPLMWLLTPKKVKYHVQSKVHKVAKEFFAQESSASNLQQYGAVSQPVLLLGGIKSREAAKAIVTLLSQVLVDNQCHWLADANHVTLFENPKVVLPLIETWLDSHLPNSVPVVLGAAQSAI